MQVRQGAVQKAARLIDSDHIAVPDQPGQYLRDSAGICDRAEIFFFLIHHPLSHNILANPGTSPVYRFSS